MSCLQTPLNAARSAFSIIPSCCASTASTSRTLLRTLSNSPTPLAEHKSTYRNNKVLKFHADSSSRPRRQWNKIRAVRSSPSFTRKSDQTGTPDYILGGIKAPANIRGETSGRMISNPWEGCRLSKILIHPQSIWNSPQTNYEAGETPKHLLTGLSASDRDLIFGAVPHVSTALMYDPNAQRDVQEQTVKEEVERQDKQTEMMYRIMDLRNAGRSQINALNRRRIIEEFGNGKDTGSAHVQVALLTMAIRGLNEHRLDNKKDIANRLVMRKRIMERARHLKYIKKKWPMDYTTILKDCGLDARAVEGELYTKL